MLMHYLDTSLRHLAKHWLQALLNVLSLVIGLGGCLVVALYVLDENGYDRQHPDVARSYRLQQRFPAMDDTSVALTAARLAPTINGQMGDLAQAARLMRRKSSLHAGELELNLDDFAYADPGLLRIFHLPVLAGSLEAALQAPNRLALSASLARRLFGAGPALGRSVLVDGRQPMEVAAVLEDLPGNTHLRFSGLASTRSWTALFGSDALDSWTQNNAWTYVKLAPGRSLEELEARIDAQLLAPLQAQLPGVALRLELMPLADIHLHSRGVGEQGPNGDARQLRVFALVAAVMLLVSVFNYVNLATARAAGRDREVGLRSVLGASRWDIAGQFLLEHLLLTALAFVLALGLAALALPLFNTLFGKSLALGLLLDSLPLCLALYAGTALLAGFYPALVLARLQPLAALKGLGSRGQGGARLRRGVLLLQLGAGLALLIWGGHTWLQLRYLAGLPTGYARDDRILITNLDSAAVNGHYAALSEALLRSGTVLAVAAGEQMPTMSFSNFLAARVSAAPSRRLERMAFGNVLPGYFQTLGVTVLAGREFGAAEFDSALPWDDPRLGERAPAVLLNRLAARQFGWYEPAEALGQELDLAWDPGFERPIRARVLGVIEDYLPASAHEPHQPVLYTTGMPYAAYSQLALHYREGALLPALAELRARWRGLTGQELTGYRLLSEAYDGLHRADQERSLLINQFAVLALACVCLGLVGMCGHVGQRRLRELAIREVLGASRPQLIWLLAREFVALAGLSALLAWPLAWWASERWLAGFSERIGQAYWLYLMATVLVVALTALVTAAVGRTLARASLRELLKND